jgi:hypothetical protein
MTKQEVLNRMPYGIRPMILSADPVGSMVTCDPPAWGTDEDWLLLLAPTTPGILELGFAAIGGWVREGSMCSEGSGEFTSYRYQTPDLNLNIIITEDQRFLDRFMLATKVSTRLNLKDKNDRITLFQAILYGNPPLP